MFTSKGQELYLRRNKFILASIIRGLSVCFDSSSDESSE